MVCHALRVLTVPCSRNAASDRADRYDIVQFFHIMMCISRVGPAFRFNFPVNTDMDERRVAVHHHDKVFS